MRILKAFFEAGRGSAVRERRAVRRLRTRLRPGKILGRDYEFLFDCAILDRTARGVRVRCFGPLGPTQEHVAVFDEKDGTVRSGRLVWRQGGEAGIRLDETPPPALDPRVLRRLSAPYYAVTD